MAHPILSVLVARPDLVVEHVAGYAELVREEASALGTQLARRAIAGVLAAVGLLVGLTTAGVAVMLGVTQGAFHPVLVAVPGSALLVSVLAWVVARQRLPAEIFGELKAQFDADARALHAAGART
ncbi:hypothetical protein [Ramlibacter sp. AN1133]|uniref:hypothetical protein n=1 Tax=Ramlibacter sp. AN1133 TaxID=3133429 RepID=UPI0030C50D65